MPVGLVPNDESTPLTELSEDSHNSEPETLQVKGKARSRDDDLEGGSGVDDKENDEDSATESDDSALVHLVRSNPEGLAKILSGEVSITYLIFN